MAYRPRGYGLTAEVKRKLEAKYEVSQEQEAREWMEKVVGEVLVEGADRKEPLGPLKFQRALKDGVFLCKLANAIMGENTCKISKPTVAFKEMENINNFIKACEKYGMAKTDLFQTADLYEYTNMWQVILTIFALGRKAQTNGYKGPVLGPKESTRNYRRFDDDTLRAGETMIGLQSGTNKLASQKGMAFGNIRHIADISVSGATAEGKKFISLQMGTNQYATQKGIVFGASRGITDLKLGEAAKEGNTVISPQMGCNKLATQAGMSFGSSRGIADKGHVMEATPESKSMMNPQMGTNQHATQAGMSYGKSRGIADIKVERPLDQTTLNLQMGTNQVASQKGMSFGGKRDINKHRVAGIREGHNIIPLQMGTNKGANQAGMNYGKSRGINDIRVSAGSTGTGSPTRSNSSSSQGVESPRADRHDGLYDDYEQYHQDGVQMSDGY